MKTISRYIMTLALLLTAVGGAWADGTVTVTEIKASDIQTWANDRTIVSTADLPGFNTATEDAAKAWTGVPSSGTTFLLYEYDTNQSTWKYIQFEDGGSGTAYTYNFTRDDIKGQLFDGNKVYYTGSPAASGPEVAWNASTKTGTFEMPGSDVVLTPIYAKAAAFATTGTETEVKTLLPEAAEGVIAGTDASLIAEGTGIVAFAGESTEVTQGTVMYAIGTSATEAPALTAFSATVPTAKNVADDGADVYVWYYIQGADAPEGDAATLDNTFDNTEPACLTVQVLTNKFDITFNAANANTIEAGKATVTVGGTAATVTDGKLSVKAGQTVTLTAAQGYKFRSVEAKKAASKVEIQIGDVTLDITGCTTWEDIVNLNSAILGIGGGDVYNKNTFRYLQYGDKQYVKSTQNYNANDGYYWQTGEK
ncbi:MAG: hypothetical protein II949_09915 [Prevotella sp.]|nr:hypothetical protein [Prevotella sp.]